MGLANFYRCAADSHLIVTFASARTVYSRKRMSSVCYVLSTSRSSSLVCVSRHCPRRRRLPSVHDPVLLIEERPDHELKLHQYCSGDIRDIIQRQTKVCTLLNIEFLTDSRSIKVTRISEVLAISPVQEAPNLKRTQTTMTMKKRRR